jgi:hypothetical protein
MATASTKQVQEVGKRLQKSERTIWRWVAQGCNLASERSIRAFSKGKELRKTNVQKARERREAFGVSNGCGGRGGREQFGDLTFKDLPAPGRKGAAAALERLEKAEERAHARLQLAIEEGNDYLQTQELQDFWLRCSETLRKLDLSVELARRDSEEQIPKRQAEDLSLFISEWLRIAFAQFLSYEGPILIGIKELGEWKKYAVERFKGILESTVKGSLKTNSPIPAWAADKIREAWNVNCA